MDWEATLAIAPDPTHGINCWYEVLGTWEVMFTGTKTECERRIKIMKSNASRRNAKYEIIEL